jgi:hypothetical protein
LATRNLARQPLPWPFRLLGWLLFGTVALIVVGGVAVIGSGIYYELTRTKPGEVESAIEEWLPRGASTDQIVRFLDSRGIEYDQAGAFNHQDGELVESGVPAGAATISAVLRNNGYTLNHTDIAITFILDERNLLKDYVVREVGR